MLPENDTYGPWPLSGKFESFLSSLCGSTLSGEIDIVESRGNNATYAGQYVGPPLFLPFC